MDIDVILHMGFFIHDLHRQLEHLHKKQYGDYSSAQSFTLYLGQGLSMTEFDEMMNSKGGLLSFNNFLSTSEDRDVSLAFAEGQDNLHSRAKIESECR